MSTLVGRKAGLIVLLLIVAPMLLVQIPNAYAATKTWVAGSGVWDVAANWSPVGVPGPNDDVHITTAVTVTMSGIDSARSITLGAPATLTCSGCILNVGPGGVISAGTFNIPAGIVGICGTYVNTGTLANSGIFTIGSNILNSGGTVNNTGIMDANILFGLIINSGILTFSGTAGDCVLTVNLHLRTYKIVNVQVQVLQGSTVVAARTVTLSYAAPNAVLTFTGLPLGDLTVKINGYSIRTQTQFTFISDFPSSVSFLTG